MSITTDAADAAAPSASRASEAVRGLEDLGRRYVVIVRCVTIVPVAAIALLAPSDDRMRVDVAVAFSAVGVWSVIYLWRARRPNPSGATVADAVVLSGLALATPWLVPAEWVAQGRSWLIPFVAFAAVVYQYSVGRLAGAACALLLSVALIIGTASALPPGGCSASLVSSGWVLVLSALARMLWMFVRQGGVRADEAQLELERARQERSVAVALRKDQEALRAALHDTAATTLLMVGLGSAPDSDQTARLAARDLEVLRGFGTRTDDVEPERLDLMRLLHGVVALSSLSVDITGPRRLWLAAPVANAIAGACAESLTNVARHADTTEARIDVRDEGDGVEMRVTDFGRGISDRVWPALAPAVDRFPAGRGIADSIVGRMAGVGGRGQVGPAQCGTGTVVTLVWPARD